MQKRQGGVSRTAKRCNRLILKAIEAEVLRGCVPPLSLFEAGIPPDSAKDFHVLRVAHCHRACDGPPGR
jgi:hypothetical protein